ncbi:hypothetical protein ACFL2D_00785 [Patescibacteria group bacterium]
MMRKGVMLQNFGILLMVIGAFMSWSCASDGDGAATEEAEEVWVTELHCTLPASCEQVLSSNYTFNNKTMTVVYLNAYCQTGELYTVRAGRAFDKTVLSIGDVPKLTCN